MYFRGQACLTLGFSKFADDLGPRALGALFLWNRIVGTRELGGRAVSARVYAVAFDFATVAGVCWFASTKVFNGQ